MTLRWEYFGTKMRGSTGGRPDNAWPGRRAVAILDMAFAAQHDCRMADKPRKKQQVFTLLVEVGRSPGDGLPDGATGAALMCYASGVDEAEAVRETVVVLKQAELSPLDVSGYGTLEERLAEGHDIDEDERALMDRALAENAVIVAQMTPFYDP